MKNITKGKIVKIWNLLKLPVIILALGLVIITLIIASKPTPQLNEDLLTEPPRVKVLVKEVVREEVVLSATSQGTVTAKRDIDLVAQVSGLIINVDKHFVDGGFVDKNIMLIEIDARDYQAALLNAKSRLAQAERGLAEEKGRSRQAKREWRDLRNKDANDLFLRKPQLAEATAAVEYAAADVELAELNIKRTKISVPFDGRITETYVNEGQFVTTGTKLANIYDTAVAEVRLPLSDRQLALLELPMLGKKIDSKPRVQLSATIGGQSHQWQGIITRTEASVDVNSRMYHAIVEVVKPFELSAEKNHSLPLMPGLFVHAKIEGKKLQDVIVLPKIALVKRSNIYTLADQNTIEIQPVTVLSKTDSLVWLQSAITDKTVIVLEKHAVLSPGTIIEPIFGTKPNDNNTVVTQVAVTSKQGD